MSISLESSSGTSESDSDSESSTVDTALYEGREISYSPEALNSTCYGIFDKVWDLCSSGHNMITTTSQTIFNSLSGPPTDYDSKKISNLMESTLCRTSSIQHLSTEDLLLRFHKLIAILADSDDSTIYGLQLREAEEILLKLKTNPDSNVDTAKMKEQYLKAFQNTPMGPGILTQLEVDHLKNFAIVPQNVFHTNQCGKAYLQPPVSNDQLISLFFALGYSNVMYSRAVKGFEDIHEVCDVVLIGIETSLKDKIFELFFMEDDQEEALEQIRDYLQANVLGYNNVKCSLIKDLKDQEKAKSFQEQGFQICVVLTYPEKGFINSQ